MTEQTPIIKRSVAITLGLPRYFTGKACKHGHVAERYTQGRVCIECSQLNSASYQINNKEKELIRSRRRRKDNLEQERRRVREYQKRKREEDLPGAQAKAKEWRQNNPEKQREYVRKRLLSPKVRLSFNTSKAIRDSLFGAKIGRKWESLVNYTVDDLRAHLERLFQPGMTWENYGRYGWHVDHIVPLAVHNFETPDDIDFQKAWALSNLQPLWAHDNLSKKDTLTSPFQPALALAIVANDNHQQATKAVA